MTFLRNHPLATGVAIGLVVIAAAVTGVVYMQRGAHIEVTGRILKVRTAPLDEHSSVAVVDFRFTNPADYPFEVNSVTVILEEPSGAQHAGSTVAAGDTELLLQGIPLLGHAYNPVLIARDRIQPHGTLDRMVAARFEAPESTLEKRKRLILQISEVDGAMSEISEK